MDPFSPPDLNGPAAMALDIDRLERAYQRLAALQSLTNNETRESIRLSRQFGSALGAALEGLIFKGRGLGDILRSLALSLSRIAFRAAFRPLEQGFGSLLSGLLSAGGVPALSGISFMAKGGVIASPVAFPFGNGAAIAGEAGPEAILPLARGPDGRLGVTARGGGGINITFNVAASDVDSFRRSEAQIAALIARTVSAGQRNL
jgi:phage-related minor tail protein